MLVYNSKELCEIPLEHFDHVLEIIAHAFFHDPLIEFIFPDEKTRFKGSQTFFSVLVKHVFQNGEVVGIKLPEPKDGNPYAAVSLWYQGKEAFGSLWSYLRVGAIKFVFSDFRSRLMKLLSLFNKVEQNHKTLVEKKHYYLSILGANPQYKGQGFISRLLKPIFQALDEQQTPIYLETMNPQNVLIYQHLEFQNVGEIAFSTMNLYVWSLLRNPKIPKPNEGKN